MGLFFCVLELSEELEIESKSVVEEGLALLYYNNII
jgi:hypothetical protein